MTKENPKPDNLISQNDLDSIQETGYLNSIPGMREYILEGLNEPIERCSKDLDDF